MEEVLAGLDQEGVHTACDQARALGGERILEALVGDLAERRQLGSRPDRAEHEALAPVDLELGHRLARELGGALVECQRLLLEAELGERHRRAAEAVGLDRVRSGLEVSHVDIAHEVGS